MKTTITRRALRAAVIALALTGHPACAHKPRPVAVAAAEASIPQRTLTRADAAILLWRTELRPGWRDPSEEEQAAIASLIPRLFAVAGGGVLDDATRADVDRLGMLLEQWTVEGRSALVLREKDDARRGAGAYLIQLRPAPRDGWTLLEAPHAYHDRRTGEISLSIFFGLAGDAPRALFTNTLHRYTQPDGTRLKDDDNPADAAHNPRHLFAVATRAALDLDGPVTVVQIHGFAGEGEDSPPPGTLAVVSGGDRAAPTPFAVAVDGALTALWGEGVRRYPDEASVLGGTTNTELASVREVAGASFLHIELSPETRERLAASPADAQKLGQIVLSSIPRGR